ncbi:NAD-dependent protein deacetylase [Euzebya tangerina]|uniref:NAD-dependent protein deacetylase n=1 Tax=Euzebya tangerina TaxID=591198 RepID=UPI000E3186D8|nr:NAD-dependent protein deacetylase [Euzebya tangerina]
MSVVDLEQLVAGTRPWTVLSGAGISTDSGIPDYRGSGVDQRRRPSIRYREFMREPHTRRRYWARSHVGYRWMAAAEPNDGHRAVAALQTEGLVGPVLTQNVDGLHQRAGAEDVVELHGSVDRVICTSCGQLTTRRSFAARLAELNPDFHTRSATIAPDGDADLPDDEVETFRVPPCLNCGGVLKPDVVFFGESMPRVRRDHASALLAESAGLLVLGSSLTVMSGYRLVLQADKAELPIAIVTRGQSRGDHLATVKVDASLSEVLPALARSTDRDRAADQDHPAA